MFQSFMFIGFFLGFLGFVGAPFWGVGAVGRARLWCVFQSFIFIGFLGFFGFLGLLGFRLWAQGRLGAPGCL